MPPPLSEQDDKAPKSDAAPASNPAAPSAAPPATDAKADAPAAPEGPKSLLDAAMAAIKPPVSENQGQEAADKKGTETDKAKAPESKDSKAADAQESDGISEEEMKGLPQRTAKRIKDLLASRADERSQKDAALTRVNELEPKSQSFDHIVGFMRDASLSPEEVSEGFELMRLMKNDPVKALQTMKPYYDQLVQLTGGVLSPELQAAVDKGEISEAHARSLQQAQSREALAIAQVERTAKQIETQRQGQTADTLAKARNDAWTNWVTVQTRADPEFSAMQDFIVGETRALMAAGIPDVSKLPALFDQAKANVVARLAKFRPPKQAVEPVRPSSQQAPSGAPAKEPASLMEAAMAAIGR